MNFQTQKFLVAGISKSGISACEFLLNRKATVYIYDEVMSGAVEENYQKLIDKGAISVSKNDLSNAINICDILVLSPGIAIDHELALAFKRLNKRIIGEMELGFSYLKAQSVAITGTNGKTTTVSMLTEILKKDGQNAVACGNIGKPLCSVIENLNYNDTAVVEVSSFQLETMTSHRPHIAVVLNITEDHLVRHYSMQNYIFLKNRLLMNLKESEYSVLNFDDEIVAKFTENLKSKIKYFSLKEKVDGAYLSENTLCYQNEKIMKVEELALKGKHNVANALASICVCKLLNVSNEIIRESLSEFKGVSHRIETVDEIDGVLYINDSKGTNVDATINAIECMDRETIILLGGKDKGYEYDKLFIAINASKVIHAVIYGENRFKILFSAQKNGFNNLTLCNNFDMSVKIASMLAKDGQCVLLSPASSSFDMFTCFEERGEKFKALVESLKDE